MFSSSERLEESGRCLWWNRPFWWWWANPLFSWGSFYLSELGENSGNWDFCLLYTMKTRNVIMCVGMPRRSKETDQQGNEGIQ